MASGMQATHKHFVDQAMHERKLMEDVASLIKQIEGAQAQIELDRARLQGLERTLEVVSQKNNEYRQIPGLAFLFDSIVPAAQSQPPASTTAAAPSPIVSAAVNTRSIAPRGRVIDEKYGNVFPYNGIWTEFSCNICGANARKSTETKAAVYFSGAHGLFKHVSLAHYGDSKITVPEALANCTRRVLSDEDVDLIMSGSNPVIAIKEPTLAPLSAAKKRPASPIRNLCDIHESYLVDGKRSRHSSAKANSIHNSRIINSLLEDDDDDEYNDEAISVSKLYTSGYDS